jgi:predicted dehydrogenase
MKNSTPRARIACIGAGNFATRCIYPCFPLAPQIDLVAICDADRAKAEHNARCFGARASYTDIEEMLEREKPDGVFCIGPAPMQYELAPLMLRRGIPVFLEKPSAVTSSQARELCELAQRHNTWGQVGFMKRFAHIYQLAKDVIGKPEFGPLHLLNVKFSQGPYPAIWGIDSPHRSMLIGQFCHLFDLARFFAGDIASVTAHYHEATPKQFAYQVMANYKNGVSGLFDLNSLESRSGIRDIVEEVQLIGLETRAVCRDMLSFEWQPREDWNTSVPRLGGYQHAVRQGWGSVMDTKITYGYLGEVTHFALRCLGQAEGGPDLWDSYEALLIGEAIYESARCNAPMTVPR